MNKKPFSNNQTCPEHKKNYKTNLRKHHKPKLHKETGLKIKRKIKKKKEARMNTLKQKAPRLDF